MKKGTAWVSYILATLFFVGMAITMIVWSQNYSESNVEKGLTYAAGRLDCQSIRIAADLVYSAPNCDLTIENKGTLNIQKLLLRYGETQDELEGLILDPNDPGKKTQNPSIPWTGEVSIMPIIEVNDEMIACTDKTLTLICE
jgi:hypothetical protein